MLRACLLVCLTSSAALAQSPWIDDCGLEPGAPVHLPVPPRDFETPFAPGEPPVVRRVEGPSPRFGGLSQPRLGTPGGLTGKTVYLSPGHGFAYLPAAPGWRTQRPTTNAIVEDLVSAETLDQFLVPMLLNAGAEVVPVRETDLTTSMVIVDDADPGYVESGAGFSDSSLAGWGRPPSPMDGATNPFALAKNRLMPAAATPTASATWTATVPETGEYNVYLSWTAFSGRVPDAHFVVRHPGGETHFRINQRHHGGSWVLLGRFHFDAAQPAQVVAFNDSTATGNLSLDAVRFGGGMGLIDRGGGTSGRPRFEECARYQAQFAGAPASVYAPSANTPADDRTNDVGTRSRFAAWVHEPGEDAAYLAWHTNATGTTPSTAVGTTTYVYGPNPPDGTYNFTGVDGGDRLAQLVHGEMINDFRQDAGWNEPGWRDRGIDSAYFGELSPTNNPEMPSVLVEVAFHDAVADATRLKEPRFRYIAARAMAQGLVRYFAEKDGKAPKYFPEPPERLLAVGDASGQVTLSWSISPTDAQGVRGGAATGYRVYASPNGLDWDEGSVAAGTSLSVAVSPGQARFFRVTGVNGGGESFPSAVVAARVPAAGQAKVLIINAYDRLEGVLGTTEAFPSQYALADALRVFIARMNDATLLRAWGDALDVNAVAFDSATVDALNAGAVSASGYALVGWAQGRGHAGGSAPTTSEQAVLSGARGVNTPVLFSGRAITAPTFAASTLAAVPGAGASSLVVTGAGPLAGLALGLDDGTRGSYACPAPDVAGPGAGALSLGSYSGAGGAGSGVAGQVAFLPYPFENIVGRQPRAEVMRRLLAFLSPTGIAVMDGGIALDGGVEPWPDAGVSDDGGVASDAGALVDAGAPLDAGSLEDAGVRPDAGQAPDGGTPLRVPVLTFEGGGCRHVPGAAWWGAALLLAGISRRRR